MNCNDGQFVLHRNRGGIMQTLSVIIPLPINKVKNVKIMEKDPKINTWHGIPREQIDWYPSIEEDLCIGCGICYLGCGAGVYDFNLERNKPEVIHPQQCKVGCVTCANTCPSTAISFPPVTYVHKLIKKNKVVSFSKEEVKKKKN